MNYDTSNSPTYEAIVKGWGYDIVAEETFGDYQGDLVFLLADNSRFGWCVIGYGSCSGCDALEAAMGYSWEEENNGWTDEVIQLANGLYNEVRWFDTAAELAAWLEPNEDAPQWYWYEKEYKEFAIKIRESLLA